MDRKTLKKWRRLQNKTFTPSEFELMLKLYSGEHINLKEDIIGKSAYSLGRKALPQDSLLAKGMVEINSVNGYGYSLTHSGWVKMEEISKLVERNLVQRILYRLNYYPVAISLISAIVGAIIALIGGCFL